MDRDWEMKFVGYSKETCTCHKEAKMDWARSTQERNIRQRAYGNI
jgi:hypothetical protein